MTPYYEDDAVTIYHGDCLEVMSQLEVEPQMIFTSPPYNLGVSSGGGIGAYAGMAKFGARGGNHRWSRPALADGYDGHDDAMPTPQYHAWQRRFLSAAWDLLSDDGAIFYNHKPRIQDGLLWTPLDVNPGLPVRQIVTWARAGGINSNPTYFMPTYEWIVIYAKPNWRLKSKAASSVGDCWRVTQEPNTEHPAPFPLRLPTIAIEAAGPGLVLDPFMGSGTTLRAAKNLGVRAIGIDKSEAYCEMAARRMGQEVLAL